MKLIDRTRSALGGALRAMLGNWGRPERRIQHYRDGNLLEIVRQRVKSETFELVRGLRCGPNHVHAYVTHPDGTVDDLGISTNLLTNIGRDWWSGQWGFIPTAQNGPATATSANSVTGTGTTWTASNLATPQLGLAGMRVFMPVTGLTTAPVYGNIISNTSSVATIDKWWKADDTAGTTPAATNALIIVPGGMAALRFVALSTDSGAASATHTTLTSEVTTNGCGRVLALYTHAFGATTLTLTNTFTALGTVTGVHKAGAFTCLSSAGADPMIYETVLNQDASLVANDTLALTWTFTPSG